MSDHVIDACKVSAARVQAVLAKPLALPGEIATTDDFDPWELFPAIYGSYDSEFDRCAIEVLCEVRDGERRRGDLAADMFREMLCTAELCDYGSSPRVCFPTMEFRALLPDLISKWREYSQATWEEQVTESK
ncbi:hypothetical protein [Leisingera sp. M523]|uniref:hypothetical protein n=1 Tax=Leisingera sp. M523 TaxID=2867013 RepID=UPI0021A5A99E|nr:hypothetical protein [Leisingera sp. M523]UWQ29932.1 hypothetical protein K3557_05120 [Leisingera sp. M523]